jgi:hypothetical protein
MEAAGIEPASRYDASDEGVCFCESCLDHRAAVALHPGVAACLRASLIDIDLQSVVVAWGKLPETIRKKLLKLIASVSG